MEIVKSFRQAIVFFDDLRKKGFIADYALIGGLALSAWVRPRTTRDVDLVVAIPEHITWSDLVSIIETRLSKKVAVQKGTKKTNIQEKLSFVEGQIEVDVISTKGFDLADEAIKHSVSVKIFDKNVKVVTPEYLILLKLLPLSSQDAIDIKELLKNADKRSVTTLAKKYYLFPKLEKLMPRHKK